MFTGIVEERGTVIDLQVNDAEAGSARLTVRGPLVTSDAGHGDSIAVSGVCLTVVDRHGGHLHRGRHGRDTQAVHHRGPESR